MLSDLSAWCSGFENRTEAVSFHYSQGFPGKEGSCYKDEAEGFLPAFQVA